VKTDTEIARDEPTITMTRVYEAPRTLVWSAMSEARHIRKWWGGRGVVNPICEMDVRPGGIWNHVMRFPDGQELRLQFVFLEVVPPERLVWQQADLGSGIGGLPATHTTVTLDDLGAATRWKMVARFRSIEDRDAALTFGFARPIESSGDALTEYLMTM